MLLHMVKKDFLLIKKYLLIMMAVAFAIPLFICAKIGSALGSNSGFVGFCVETIFIQLILFSSISLAETKFSKAQAFFCATPYTRKLLVLGRYLFNFLLFVYCLFAYIVTTILFPNIMGVLNVTSIAGVFLIITIILSIFIPLEYKLGYEKTKYIYMLTMLSTSFILPSIVNMLDRYSTNLNVFSNLPLLITIIIFVVLALLVGSLSAFLSIKIYSKKEF